tara:strand:- start:3329 stop:3502 length:174 start_codon:yes stop_codon:yes gene_type:complete
MGQDKELELLITALEANLEVFKMFNKDLNLNNRRELLYPILIQLEQLCKECIPSFRP